MKLWRIFVIFFSFIIVLVAAIFFVGYETRYIKEFPYHVNLLLKDRLLQCSGVIISEHFILTTAQCVLKLKAKQLSVRTGTRSLYNKDGEGKTYQASKIIRHENFGWASKYGCYVNDIALVAIKSGINFTTNTKSINMANNEIKKFKNPRMTNWRGGTSYRSNLRWKDVPYVQMENCNKSWYWRRSIYLNDDKFCAGYGNKALTNCHTEMGAPLVAWKNVVGILSIYSYCQREIIPEVFTNISYHFDWAQQKIDNWENEVFGSTTESSDNNDSTEPVETVGDSSLNESSGNNTESSGNNDTTELVGTIGHIIPNESSGNNNSTEPVATITDSSPNGSSGKNTQSSGKNNSTEPVAATDSSPNGSSDKNTQFSGKNAQGGAVQTGNCQEEDIDDNDKDDD